MMSNGSIALELYLPHKSYLEHFYDLAWHRARECTNYWEDIHNCWAQVFEKLEKNLLYAHTYDMHKFLPHFSLLNIDNILIYECFLHLNRFHDFNGQHSEVIIPIMIVYTFRLSLFIRLFQRKFWLIHTTALPINPLVMSKNLQAYLYFLSIYS